MCFSARVEPWRQHDTSALRPRFSSVLRVASWCLKQNSSLAHTSESASPRADIVLSPAHAVIVLGARAHTPTTLEVTLSLAHLRLHRMWSSSSPGSHCSTRKAWSAARTPSKAARLRPSPSWRSGGRVRRRFRQSLTLALLPQRISRGGARPSLRDRPRGYGKLQRIYDAQFTSLRGWGRDAVES